jgi:CRP-like cAMP-binding protein
MSAVRLNDNVLVELEQICELRQFKPGEQITVQGEHHECMFFILTGWVDIRFHDGSGATSSLRVGERSALGEMGFLTGKSAGATAVAVSAVTAYELDSEALKKLEVQNPSAADEFSLYLTKTIDNRLKND